MSASNVKSTILVFGCFRLDVNERLLDANGKPVPLTPKVFDLLVLLVQNPGKLLGKDWLLDAMWPGTFVEEANLTVNISTLRRALESAGGAHYIETVPKRGYRFTGEVLEIFLPVEADAKESSAALESQIPKGKSRSRLARIYLAGAAIALIVATLSYFWLARWNRRNDGIVWVRSMAVLPFRPLIAAGERTGDNTYLGPGMSDAIIRKLSAVRKVTVRATSAVQKYQGANVDPIAAGRELRVDVVLDGTIQHADNAIRVSVQLLRVSDGSPVWADHYDDYYTNLFQMQDSISEKIVAALSMKLTESEHRRMAKRQTSNSEAYQAYLQGNYCLMRRTLDAPAKACVALFQQAVTKDPDYALAYSGMAIAYMEIASMDGDAAATKKARQAVDRAILLDDELTEAHLARGSVLFRGDWDWFGAQREFDRALELDSHFALAHWYMSILTMAMGHTERALSEMREAQLLDPTSQNAHDDLAWAYYCNRRHTEAIKESKIAIEMDPRSISAHHQFGKALLQLHRYSEARQEFETTTRLDDSRRGFADLGQLNALTGNVLQARAILAELEQSLPNQKIYEAPYMRAVLLGALGDKDSAFRSLEEAVSKHLSRAVWMRVDPDIDPLRRDPRFDALLRRVHLLN